MNLQETVSKILGKEVTIEQAKTFAHRQFGALAAYLRDNNPSAEVDDILRRLTLIENSEELTKEFRTQYGTDFTSIRTFTKNGMTKPKAINFIKKLTDDLVNNERVTEAMIQKAANDYLSMDYDDVARVLREIDLDANIKDGDMLDTCHEELQVAEQFEFCFTVGNFFNQIR